MKITPNLKLGLIQLQPNRLFRRAGLRPETLPLRVLYSISSRYEDLREIACGAMGVVRLVRDTLLNRNVAMKLLRSEIAGAQPQVEQLIAEARLTGRLGHPNIIPIHECGIDANGVAYFTMKAVLGQSLGHWLADPRRQPGSASRLTAGLGILLRVCDAVSFAHCQGVIHRDLKPGNVMVGDDGTVYLIDWGLARSLGRGDKTTPSAFAESAAFVGTLGYMSPEAARGEASTCDERCDVFGLGAIAYEIATGNGPYDGESNWTLWQRARLGEWTPIGQASPTRNLPERLVGIVRKSMAPRCEDRHRSASALKGDIEDFLANRGSRTSLRESRLG
jgi:serine/threonine protein kinase